MPVLNLGVIVQPYAHSPKGQTTADVAEILEEKYGVMQFFFDHHAQEIADDLTNALAGELDSLLMGKPPGDPYASGTSRIEERFHDFLALKEMDGAVDGVPTAASLGGDSKRFKKVRERADRRKPVRGPRPSFIDTSLYENSFKAWVD
jgi:hypothetical protein